MDPESRKEALIFPHTHWDRAWYWPFERFRTKLCECFEVMITMLREYSEYHFSCDGQTLMIEDYPEVCPESRTVLQASHFSTGTCRTFGPPFTRRRLLIK